MIELGFVVKGYPGSGRRVEEELDLSQVSSPDLVQGAFMGDAVFKVGAVDFSTQFGWVTLLDWCLRLTVSLDDLVAKNSRRFEFSESDDFVSFERHQGDLLISCSYGTEVATVGYEELKSAVRDFVDDHLEWIEREFPAAMHNQAMPDVFSRLRRPFPPLREG
jgi:hypothetical protein